MNTSNEHNNKQIEAEPSSPGIGDFIFWLIMGATGLIFLSGLGISLFSMVFSSLPTGC